MQGSALAAMVGQLTYGKRIWESLDTPMRKLIPVFDQASKDMVRLHLLSAVCLLLVNTEVFTFIISCWFTFLQTEFVYIYYQLFVYFL